MVEELMVLRKGLLVSKIQNFIKFYKILEIGTHFFNFYNRKHSFRVTLTLDQPLSPSLLPFLQFLETFYDLDERSFTL